MDARADSTDTGLQEVVVTAQRRQEKSQDVPLAISAFSSNDLARAGVRQAGDLAALVPNLMLGSPYGTEAEPQFSLRGVTSNDFSQNQSAPVAMYVDEAYKPVGALQALQTFDLDRVEVLRGPQGTLYGKNATGGAINFYSRNPSLTSDDGYVEAGIGNYNGYKVEGAYGGPISDGTLGWRAAVYYDKRDGWLNSIEPGVPAENGVDALAGRLTLLAKPSDTLSVQLKISGSKSGGSPYGVRPINILPDVTGSNPQLGNFQNAAQYAYDKTINNFGGVLKIDWTFSKHAMLTSVTASDYGRWVNTGDDAAVGSQIWGPDTYASTVHSASQEFRFTSVDSGPLAWIGGLYFGHDVVHGWTQYHYFDAFPGTIVIPGQEAPLYGFDQANAYDQTRETKAAFANVSYAVSPTVTVRGGLRYTDDSISVKNFFALEGGLQGPPTCFCVNMPTLWTQTIPVISGTYVNFSQGIGAQSAPLPEQATSNNNVSYKVGADWKLAPDVLSYVSVSSGYRGAAFNSQAFNAPSEVNFARPETLTAYELGVKSEFADRHVQLNAALFYYDYKNQQFLGTSAVNGVLLYNEVNSPKSTIKGGEVEFKAKVTNALQLHLNVGAQDGKYTSFVFDGIDVSGNQLPLAPKLTSSGGVDYTIRTAGDGALVLGVDGSYSSTIYWDPADTARIAQDPYFVLNARATYTFGSQSQYSISAWGKNLADRMYLAYALATQQPSQGGLGLDYTNPAEPRTFGVTATWHF
jgi:iron complex outermembrane receptor protein